MTETPITDTNAIISIIDDAIADSLGPDWNSFQAAHHVMQWLADAGLQIVPNTRADSHHRLVEALEDARTALSITRTNVMTEIGRCSDESRSPWAGVPEQLAKRIAKIDAALKEAG